jgi:hypothetical protein
MSWRYMTGSEPYLLGADPIEADRKFVQDLSSIVKERKQLAFGFGMEFSEQPQISQRMREVRTGNLDERKKVYLSERISDQRRWYGNQAKSNLSSENTYFILISITQLLAFIAAILLVNRPESRVKLTAFLTSLASSLIAWLQIKQHREIAQPYSIAELELGFIQEQAQQVTSDQEFSDFVGDAENAISREHTLWIARRDKT